MKKDNSLHRGHRQCLRERFLAQGPEGMEEVKLLEVLLFHPVRRRDTGALARQLLRRFGSLSGVLSASFQDLLDVPGVGEETAFCLTALLPLSRYVTQISEPYRPPVVRTPEDVARLVSERADPPGAPAFFVLLPDSCGCVRGIRRLSGTRLPSVRHLAQCLVDSGLPHMALAEYFTGSSHAAGSPHLDKVLALISSLEMLGCQVWDYQFIEENGVYSLRAEGLLPQENHQP